MAMKMAQKEELRKKRMLQTLAKSLGNLNRRKTLDALKAVIDTKISVNEIMNDGIAKGFEIVGKKYEEMEYFLTELMYAGRIGQDCLELVEPLLKMGKRNTLGKIVIGTVKNDLHDIGKNIVIMMLTSAGFDVYDLGIDVPKEVFVEKVREVDADIVGMSALVSMTIMYMKEVMEALKAAGLRDKVKIMIGGASATPEFATEIGADAYVRDSVTAVKIAKAWIKEKKGIGGN